MRYSPGMAGGGAGFGGEAVVIFERRRAAEMASLVERHGGRPISAPAMREAALELEGPVLAFAERLRAGELDVVALMTGVGTRALAKAVLPLLPEREFKERLAALSIAARGPKPVAVLKELGLRPEVTAPEPNTWRELLEAMRAAELVRGKRIALQEHGKPSDELVAALEAEGARVLRVPLYAYAPPEDTGPLEAALRALAGGQARICLFTSQGQVESAIAMASALGIDEALRGRLAEGLSASIGPVCSEAMREAGLPVHVEPEHPKMGHLVKAAAEARARRLAPGA